MNNRAILHVPSPEPPVVASRDIGHTNNLTLVQRGSECKSQSPQVTTLTSTPLAPSSCKPLSCLCFHGLLVLRLGPSLHGLLGLPFALTLCPRKLSQCCFFSSSCLCLVEQPRWQDGLIYLGVINHIVSVPCRLRVAQTGF